jgi:hypothetical protein
MITNTAIGTTLTTIFTSSGDNAVNLMVFCNTDAVNNGLLTVYVIPSGQSPATKHIIVKDTKLVSLETLTFSTEKLILQNGDSLRCIATMTDGSSSIDVVSTVSSIAL